ncbi:unnamed protein product [Polarella glacialis]|uniref:Coenzyme F420 hydrogenase n=1 Tax=Polarella glacialis TaxID=89957 RepID=A0A813HCE6_POLGL|nr:unnamed protein product [Polarella glacialis]
MDNVRTALILGPAISSRGGPPSLRVANIKVHASARAQTQRLSSCSWAVAGAAYGLHAAGAAGTRDVGNVKDSTRNCRASCSKALSICCVAGVAMRLSRVTGRRYPRHMRAIPCHASGQESSTGVQPPPERKKPKAKPMPQDTRVYPAKDLCSKCGFCNTSLVGKVQEACAFLGEGMAKIDRLEEKVHGRQRRLDVEDELYFGVAEAIRPIRVVAERRPSKRAWTGVITSIACEMLRSGRVDAVLCVASASPDKPMEPRPILARTVEEVLASGGVKPTLSPNIMPLELLFSEFGRDIKRLLFIGVGCQVQALRAVEADLGLESLYVLGTNCVDNPRDGEALQRFLRSASETPETATGFEFMQDNRIHVKHRDGRYERVPIFSLKDPHTCTGVIAKSCYSCHDYVNALTDLTVGYMAAPWEGGKMTEHAQYCVIRNQRGREMIDLLEGSGVLELGESAPEGGGFPRDGIIGGVLKPELDLAFGRRQPKEGPPRWLAEFLSDAITVLGPHGADFAKASIDRATLRNIVCARAEGQGDRIAILRPGEKTDG